MAVGGIRTLARQTEVKGDTSDPSIIPPPFAVFGTKHAVRGTAKHDY